MIEWKKYDPENPPEVGKDYLATDGVTVDVCGLHDYFGLRWYPPEMSTLDDEGITHYAEINLP